MQRIILFIFLCQLFCLRSYGQCGFTVSTFPYQEGFEANSGGWTSGGISNDWAWGSPSKAFITNAGGGSKCWVTGGLSGSFYNNGERSFVSSPCFNFSSLTRPLISFKIYWECENTYDGASFQSSIDNGVTWTNVGSNLDPVNCLNQNWFNNANIINLATLANPKTGWAGSSMPTSGSCQGTGGSNGWVIAKHCLGNLAGLPSVRFRFVFGAGTSCNNFDGVAFDDIRIEEAPPVVANFSYGCTSSPLQYQFTNSSNPCPSNFVWNFGDPASGVNNGTGSQDPQHTFSSPGSYTVTLTATNPCNGTSTITKTISTIGLNVSTTNLTCANSLNGSITATAMNATGSSIFSLLPSGTNNSSGLFGGLNPGNYTVNISDAIGCNASISTSISSPPQLIWSNVLSTDISCHSSVDGKINALCTGGIGTIIYSLQPGGLSNSTGNFTNLSAGNYTIIATDANGCTISSVSNIIEPNAINIINNSSQNVQCNGVNSGAIQVNFSGGTGTLNYTLYPGMINNSTGSFMNLNAGVYTIVCSDVNSCSSSVVVSITEPPILNIDSISITQPGCNPNNDGTASVFASGGMMPLTYSIGGLFGANNFFSNMTSNTYTVLVKDGNNCSVSSIIVLKSLNAPGFASVVGKDITCFAKKDGSIQVSATGTATILQYALTPGNLVNSSGSFQSLSPNLYMITVTDVNGCTNTTQVNIQSAPELIIQKLDFINDSCGSNSAGKLICNASGGIGMYTYLLNPGNVLQSSNTFTNLSIGLYMVVVSDANSCTTYSSIKVPEKICCDDVFLPNAFSPNNDGKNDEFAIKGSGGIELLDFKIFNRWGELVFTTHNLLDSWNGHYKGQNADMGSYYYQLKYRCLSTNKNYLMKGDVILIR